MTSLGGCEKIHLGCGGVHIPGFLNVDITPSASVDLVADVKDLPFETNTVSLIYASSVLEHFGRNEWQDILEHWVGFLKPGGKMRISVPDFHAVIEQYRAGSKLEELLGLLIGGQKDTYDWHGMIFDFPVLAAGMRQAGLTAIECYDWRNTELAILDIDDYSQAYLPHMDKDNGRLMMLNVEGLKA